MTTQRYRKAAIERATSSESFKELLCLVSPHDWIMLITLCFVLVVFIFWGIFGSIPAYVTGQGILIGTNASIFDADAPEGATRIISVAVKPGDHVTKDQAVAYLDAPDLGKQVIIAQHYLKQLRDKYDILLATSKEEIGLRDVQTEQQQAILQTILQTQKEQLNAVEDLLKRKEQLEKKGLVVRQDVLLTLGEYHNIKQKINETENQFIQNKQNLNNFHQDWRERILKFELQLIDAKRDLDKLTDQLNLSKILRTPVAGIVTNIQAAVGDSIKPGDPIVSVASEGTGLDAIIFVPVQDGQRIRKGMKALVSPEIVEKQTYGSLVGHIISVSTFPTTSLSMMATLHNKELIDKFMQKGVTIAVRIHIQKNPDSFSEYQWSSGTGPDIKVMPGMVVNAQVTVEKRAPISLIIPAFKKFLEGE